LMSKQRGMMNRIVDSNTRLLSAGYNKLVEESKARKIQLQTKLRSLLRSLTDKDLAFTMAAYNGMKQRCRMLNGEGMGVAQMKKVSLIKRLTNQSHNHQVMAVTCLQQFLRQERDNDEAKRLSHEKASREKDRVLRRIMDSNLRMCGIAFRQSEQWMQDQAEKERILMSKQRGMMNRIVDSNTRLLSAGYNKLVEESKARKIQLQTKLRSLLRSLTDKDLAFTMAAYNGMKQRCRMLNGEGMGVAQMKKVSLIKRLTNQSHNHQVMAVTCLRQFLRQERDNDEAKRLSHEKASREKDRVLRRIMDSNLRMCGLAWRQALLWMEDQAELERAIMAKQRGIMRRILDAHTRLVNAGYNKLVEEAKSSKKGLQGKLRYILKS
jgi:Pyruvate/2-oxoacid:ferredoxin oxidoreductase gamma subunit